MCIKIDTVEYINEYDDIMKKKGNAYITITRHYEQAI